MGSAVRKGRQLIPGRSAYRVIRLAGTFVMALSVMSHVAFGETSKICDLAVKHGGLVEFAVKAEAGEGGSRVFEADIDLDGKADELRWLDPGPASTLPAGDSTLTLTLSSNGRKYSLEQQQISVVKFESRYYVATTRMETVLGPWYREVFAITRQGITSICSYSGKGQVP